MASDSIVLRSDKLDTSYHLFVDAPRSAEPAPLVLVLDGDDQFSSMREAARELAEAGTIPPLLLVGVGYGGGYRSKRNRRARDYTPSALNDEPMETGGADAFLSFVQAELLPALRQRHTFPADAIGVTGHSLGSLLGLHALFQPKPIFQRFLISSPSIWWDDRAILKSAAALRLNHDSLPANVYLSVGADDSPSMTGDLELLAAQLAQQPWPDLEYTVDRFPGYDHYNVLPVAFRAGLTWLYGRGA